MTSNKEVANKGGWGWRGRKGSVHCKINSFSLRESTCSLAWITVELKTQNRISLDPLVCKYSPGTITPAHAMSFQWNG